MNEREGERSGAWITKAKRRLSRESRMGIAEKKTDRKQRAGHGNTGRERNVKGEIRSIDRKGRKETEKGNGYDRQRGIKRSQRVSQGRAESWPGKCIKRNRGKGEIRSKVLSQTRTREGVTHRRGRERQREATE